MILHLEVDRLEEMKAAILMTGWLFSLEAKLIKLRPELLSD